MLQIHSWRETPESAFGNRLSKLAKAEKAFAERDAKAQKGNHREETDPPSSKPVSLTVHKRCLLHGALFFSILSGTGDQFRTYASQAQTAFGNSLFAVLF